MASSPQRLPCLSSLESHMYSEMYPYSSCGKYQCIRSALTININKSYGHFGDCHITCAPGDYYWQPERRKRILQAAQYLSAHF